MPGTGKSDPCTAIAHGRLTCGSRSWAQRKVSNPSTSGKSSSNVTSQSHLLSTAVARWIASGNLFGFLFCLNSVSYTHLDVYKRQP